MNHYQTCVQALEQMRGDDLYRARLAFKGMTEHQMQQLHGASGKTRAQVLAGYEAHDAKIGAALKWLEAKQ